jgi:hypothetical protein
MRGTRSAPAPPSRRRPERIDSTILVTRSAGHRGPRRDRRAGSVSATPRVLASARNDAVPLTNAIRLQPLTPILTECWFPLALAALACWSTRFHLRRAQARAAPIRAAPVPLALAARLPFAARLPDLMLDYQLYPASMRAKAETWASGLWTDTPDMTFHFPPDGLVVHGAPFPVPRGRYVLSADTPWYIRGVLLLFHKQSVTLLGPER